MGPSSPAPQAGEASESDSDIGADCRELGDPGAEELRVFVNVVLRSELLSQ